MAVVVVEVEICGGKLSSCSHNAVEMAAAVEVEEGRDNSKAVEDGGGGGGGGDGGCCVVFCWC